MKFKGTPSEGLLGATIAFFIGFAAVSLFGPTAKKLQDVMGLTPTMVGFLVAMPSLSGSLLRIPFAAWVDTSGGRKPILTLLLTSIIGMGGLTLLIFRLYPDGMTASLYPLLLLLGLLSGCGIATFAPGTGQVSYWNPQKKQGMALGVYAGVGNLAPGLFSLLLPLALASLGLAYSYLAWFLFLVLGTVLYFFKGRNSWFFQAIEQGATREEARRIAQERGQELFPAGSTLDSLKASARVGKTWLLVGIYFTTFGGFIAMTSWLPTYWTAFFGLSAVTAGVYTAVYSISASLFRVMGGSLADRIGGERTLKIFLVVMLAGALLMSLSQASTLSLAASLLMALGMGTANAAVFKLVAKEVPQAVGGASGWVGGLGAFGGFVLPPVLSNFVRSFGQAGYSSGFWTYVVLAVTAITFALILSRSHAVTKSTETIRELVK
jgi:NNP family nitrate/nitrite transporter-like MFS transporter